MNSRCRSNSTYGDLSQHEQTDGALILHRNIPKLTLCVGNLFGNPIASLGIGGSDDLNYECRALKYSADFTPDEVLQSIRPDVGMLPAAHVLICPATTVGPAGNGRIVAVELPVAPTARPVVGSRTEQASRSQHIAGASAADRTAWCSAWIWRVVVVSASAPDSTSPRPPVAEPVPLSTCPLVVRTSSSPLRSQFFSSARRPRCPCTSHC